MDTAPPPPPPAPAQGQNSHHLQPQENNAAKNSRSSTAPYSLDMFLRDLPLRPSTHTLLQERGFTGTCREVMQAVQTGGGMATLAAELDVEAPVAARLYREVQSALAIAVPPSTSAAHLLQQQQQSSAGGARHIITFSRAVDQLLGGGVPLGHVTELAGPPGAGKTQWALQLAVTAKLPAAYGGVAGDTLYVDAEGSFAALRCHAMATALCRHVERGRQRRHPQRPLPTWFAPETILRGIAVHRVYDVAAQTALLYRLEDLLQKQQQQHAAAASAATPTFPIRLIVVDSLAFHYRAEADSADFVVRTRHLTNLAARLTRLAERYHVAVLLLNQMTTKNDGHLVPALGVAWAHAVTTRLLLEKPAFSSQPQLYTCHLTKSTNRPSGSALYQICDEGIRGQDYIVRGHPNKPPPTTTTATLTNPQQQQQQQQQQPTAKRLRVTATH